MNNDKDKRKVIIEKAIIEKARKREYTYTICITILLLLIPFLIICLYISKYYKLEIVELLSIIIVLLISAIPIITIIFRRCPNCGQFFGKHTITFPKHCPNCGVKLK